MQLYGLLITRDDHDVFGAWCDDQLSAYDAVVCLDGSTSDATAGLARRYADRLVYLHERDFDIPHKTDHGLRGAVHREILRRFGHDNWVMCCHADEFCYHDPRKVAERAEREGYGLVSWYSPHFYPHPSELTDWDERRHYPIGERFRHYHWSYFGNGFPWVEDRLYRNGPEVAWDEVTHGSVRPHGVGKEAPFHPILRHYKVIGIDLGNYERVGHATCYRDHWPGQEHRTGLSFPVGRVEDFFVTSVPKYTRCDRFVDTFDQPWNMGEEYRLDSSGQGGGTSGCHDLPVREAAGGAVAPDRSGQPCDEPRPDAALPRPYRVACRLAARGHTAAARRLYLRLTGESLGPRTEALVANDLAVLAAASGEHREAMRTLESALLVDPACTPARLNLALLRADFPAETAPAEPRGFPRGGSDGASTAQRGSDGASTAQGGLGGASACVRGDTAGAGHGAGVAASGSGRPVCVAILSFLFNWPSTGGGIVHTVELARFLARAGYDVRHVYARHLARGVGRVEAALPHPSQALELDDSTWNVPAIQARFRRAVEEFDPDQVIVTDAWNMKPLLAEAVRGYSILRFQAMECLCPLNNVRLLPEPGGRFRQCPLHQLANPVECCRCLADRGKFSGHLHQAERTLCGVGTRDYHDRLLRALRKAEAVLVVNPLAEAMVSPYARCVKVVTAGMDPARFPWPADGATTPAAAGGPVSLLFAGLVDEWMKGFGVLHDACRLLWQRRQDFALLATAEPRGPIDAFTRFIGWQSQEELPARLRAADILVMPTIAQEALGRTAVEAMAAGRPVVASRIGGLPYTVADGATGLLCDPGDAADLARKIETLLDDPELRARMGRAGRRRFEEHYAWDVIIEKHYRPLLRQRDRKVPVHDGFLGSEI